jgi:hypothetical protein
MMAARAENRIADVLLLTVSVLLIALASLSAFL